MRKIYIILIFLLCLSTYSRSQDQAVLQGKLLNKETVIPKAVISLINTSHYTISKSSGHFNMPNITPGKYLLHIQVDGFSDFLEEISLLSGDNYKEINLKKAEVQLNEVVVTADKRETRALDVPLALSVLDSKEVNDAKIWDIKDLAAIVPNLYAAHPGDLRNVVSIRGVTTSSYEPAVATYIDGVNQFSLDSYISQLNDIERIEVLRGPQGTLYGRNASGGVINIITKQPDNQIKGFVELNYGNFGFQRYAAGIRTPIIADKLYFGASVFSIAHFGSFAQESTTTEEATVAIPAPSNGISTTELLIIMLLIFSIILLFVAITLYKSFRAIYQEHLKPTPYKTKEERLLEYEEWSKQEGNKTSIWNKLLSLRSLSAVTIILGAVYLCCYHIAGSGKRQDDEQKTELTKTELDKQKFLAKPSSSIDENSVKVDPSQIAVGKGIFDTNCAVCHGQNGEGLVGPNLTDEFWIHGGSVKDIFKLIKYGAPEKGMIAWEENMSSTDISAVTNYILSLQGSKPANAKASEGDKYAP